MCLSKEKPKLLILDYDRYVIDVQILKGKLPEGSITFLSVHTSVYKYM